MVVKMKTLVLAGAVLAACGASAATAAAGSCINKAIKLKASQAVTLVNEYDPEWKENTDTGVAWYKIALSKGTAATVWITGGDTIDMWDFSVGVNFDDYMGEDDVIPYVDFEPQLDRDDGGTKISYLYSEAWDDEDPSSVTFYVCISGEIGQKCNLYYSPKIESFSREGEEGNPKRITMKETSQKDTQTILDGDTGGAYFYTVRLEAGRKYSIRTTGGTASKPLEISAGAEFAPVDPDPAYSNDTRNASLLVYPETTSDYTFSVGGAVGQAFNLKYWAYPVRTPAKHPSTELTAKNGFKTKGIPGRVTANDKSDRSYYDDVIDEFLVRIKLVSGERWVFETSGATGPIQMRIYNSSGVTLATNDSLGKGSRDVRAAVEATYDGYYYVGVCNPALADWDPSPSGPKIEIFARQASEFTGEEDSDRYDAAGDEAWSKASLLYPAIGTSGGSAVELGEAHGPHVLSGGDWYDWYAVPCRSNLTYVLKASFDGEDSSSVTDLGLFAKVYRVVDGVLTRLNTGVRGSITPTEADPGTMQFIFTADRNGMFYVRVNVAEGVGLDYPAHSMHAMVYGADDLGIAKVDTMGLDGKWYFTDDASAQYWSGSAVAVPAGSRKVRYEDDAAYTTPAKTTVSVKKGAVTNVTGWYVDIADPADDKKSGSVVIAPTAKERKVKRTLWADSKHADAADWFRFEAAAGVYYRFWIEDTSRADDGGDAVFSLMDSSGKTLKSSLTSLSRWSPSVSGRHFIKVEHGKSPAVDTSYRLWYSSAQVGTVSFAADSVAVSESASYADVTVTRSASEGALRVQFATEALTAKPGKEYYPTNGILEWADGDSSPKIVRVRLIPDLVDIYEAQKKFKVNIWPIPEDGLGEAEYPAVISGSTFATVKIRESSAQQPGVIVASAPDPLEVTAGNTLKVVFSRTGGSNGSIAVKVKTQSSTAIMGTNGSADFDYANQILKWADGDTADKVFNVKTTACKKPAPDKMLRLKLSTLATGKYAGNLTPKLAESKIYVPIRNPLNAGTITLVSPNPRQVMAGETLKAVFRRVGGSNGSIAVKVKTQTSTAVMGTNGSADFDYAKEVLVWADGETGDKVFEVKTMPCKSFAANKQLRLKLSTLATGAYAGNFTPALAESKIYVTIWNQRKPTAKTGGPVAKISSGTDALGNKISAGNAVQLVKGVYSSIGFGAETGSATLCKVVQGSLPPGMKAENLRVYGVPSEAGDYTALVQVFNGTVGGTSLELDFHVAESDLAFGTFGGVLVETGDTSLTNKTPRLGSLSFTASATGVLSASVKVGDSVYKFSGKSGYSTVTSAGVPAGIDRFVGVALKRTDKIGDDSYTSVLNLSVADGSSTNSAAFGACAGVATLTLNLPDGLGGMQEEIEYSCELVRDNSGLDGFAKAAKPFAGYYTLALVPENITLEDGVPAGNGYLTVAVGDDGSAKCAGMLADGTAVSCALPCALRGDLSSPASCNMLIPVFQNAAAWSFGGVLLLRADGAFDSRAALEWNKDGKASSFDRLGFTLSIRPTGGWYDTVSHLQTYYLNRDFTVEATPIAGLPADMLPSGTYTLDSTPHGLAALLEADTPTVEARKLVMDSRYSELVDFAASINPWKVKMNFVRGSGVVSGTFQVHSIAAAKSSSVATCNHYGVLIMTRDETSPLDTDVWTAGFGLVPVSTYWTISIPFNIISVTVDRDWSEQTVPTSK